MRKRGSSPENVDTILTGIEKNKKSIWWIN
jgi:hypothetical protein